MRIASPIKQRLAYWYHALRVRLFLLLVMPYNALVILFVTLLLFQAKLHRLPAGPARREQP